MITTDTYMVCNSSLVQKFRSIPDFTMDLGTGLINHRNEFLPQDINIQKNYVFFNRIIMLVGAIGKLKIYTSTAVNMNKIFIYNEQNELEYALDNNMSMYDNTNTALGLFFNKFKIADNTKVENIDTVEGKKQQEMLDKKLSELSEDERILRARSWR